MTASGHAESLIPLFLLHESGDASVSGQPDKFRMKCFNGLLGWITRPLRTECVLKKTFHLVARCPSNFTCRFPKDRICKIFKRLFIFVYTFSKKVSAKLLFMLPEIRAELESIPDNQCNRGFRLIVLYRQIEQVAVLQQFKGFRKLLG